MLKDWDSGPLTRKFENRPQVIVEGQGHFTNRVLLWVIPPVV